MGDDVVASGKKVVEKFNVLVAERKIMAATLEDESLPPDQVKEIESEISRLDGKIDQQKQAITDVGLWPDIFAVNGRT